MSRNWNGERDYWLDHFGQWRPDLKRPSQRRPITEQDYIAVPQLFNLPVPIAVPCLVWRWVLGSGGYGVLSQGDLAHRVAFEQARGVTLREGEQVLHFCMRPFCVQPAHLYLGTPKENAEDRQAFRHSELHSYRTWGLIHDRWDKSREAADHCWLPPSELQYSPHFGPPLECPHVLVHVPSAGEWVGCLNCERHAPTLGMFFANHQPECKRELYDIAGPCRCVPCDCEDCQMFARAEHQGKHPGELTGLDYDDHVPLAKSCWRCETPKSA